jgi:AraC-like DNA-binding protein
MLKKTVKTDSVPSRQTRASGPGEVRIGPVQALPKLLRELGVDPQRAFAQASVDAGVFDQPENRLRVDDLGRLLEVCVALTGRDDFGLRVGERFDLKRFGLLGELMRHSASVGDALRMLLSYLHLHDRGAAPLLLGPAFGSVMLGYSIYRHGVPASAQVHDGAIAIAYRLLAELCGPAWKAQRVQFSHGRPVRMAEYRRVFGPSLGFDAEVSAIVFDPAWLDQPIAGADALRHLQLARLLQEAAAAQPLSLGEQVQGMLQQMVLNGTANAGAVAQRFGVHERTLRRRLQAQGTSLQQLIGHTRFELAQQLLRNTALSVTAIAAALHYKDANAFSRAFRGWAQLSPMQWRDRQ